MRRLMYVCWSVLILTQVFGQNKRVIDTDAYYRWKSISEEEISNSGNWVAYKEVAYRGNDSLVLQTNGSLKFKWGRVTKFHMDPNERFIVFQQTLDYDSIRQLKIQKVKKKKWPADSLGVYLALTNSSDTIVWFKQVSGFEVGKENSIVLINHDESLKLPKDEEKEPKCKFLRKKKTEILTGKSDLEGAVMTILNTTDLNTVQVENVLESSVSDKGGNMAYVVNYYHDTVNSQALYVGSYGVGLQMFTTPGSITNLTWSENGKMLAFNISVDTSEAKRQQLYLLDYASTEVKLILDTVSDYFKKYQSVSNSGMNFSKDESKLFFKVGIKSLPAKKDSIPEDEMAKLDVWSWTDGEIQPQQLLGAKKDALALVDYVYHLNDDKVVQLQDSSIQSIRYPKGRMSDFAMLLDQTKYLSEMTWDYWYYDVYRVNLITGKKELLGSRMMEGTFDLSPSGKYFTYWNGLDSSWNLLDIEKGNRSNITAGISDQFFDQHHDVPIAVSPSGNLYWLEDEQAMAIESQNNFWIVPRVGKPYKFTKGKENNEKYTLLQLDEEEEYVNLIKGFYLKAFNYITKSESIYRYGMNGLEKIGEWDESLLTIIQSMDKSRTIIEKMSFTSSPNLFIGGENLEKLRQITDVNPQQKEYNWGTVELVSWKDYEGDSVNGLLYKPENFDSNKIYPMIVYYYERYTDDIHRYYKPKPTASIIYPTEYVSNGYIVFIPDITYEIGYPARGAYNVIMSGTDAMLKQFPNIDSTRMGLQGQSWGGYQTAQLVTMTKRYKCAMAGAPVSNMFSAYGGVRWGSGLSRTFQYETGQSRIGATIWEKPELYIENSPLFHLPKVETPLLIMHNDGDGAVPWYQGIEMYQGLRRLQKPVWMLNYNDDEHNLMKDANRMDLSIRMRQFFDHYLLEAPAPVWMVEGVPAYKKGTDFGLELND